MATPKKVSSAEETVKHIRRETHRKWSTLADTWDAPDPLLFRRA